MSNLHNTLGDLAKSKSIMRFQHRVNTSSQGPQHLPCHMSRGAHRHQAHEDDETVIEAE